MDMGSYGKDHRPQAHVAQVQILAFPSSPELRFALLASKDAPLLLMKYIGFFFPPSTRLELRSEGM